MVIRAVKLIEGRRTQERFDELNLLERLAPFIGQQDNAARRYLFSRTGFTDRLRAYAGSNEHVVLLTTTDIYAA